MFLLLILVMFSLLQEGWSVRCGQFWTSALLAYGRLLGTVSYHCQPPITERRDGSPMWEWSLGFSVSQPHSNHISKSNNRWPWKSDLCPLCLGGYNYSSLIGWWWGWNGCLGHAKYEEQCLAYTKCSVNARDSYDYCCCYYYKCFPKCFIWEQQSLCAPVVPDIPPRGCSVVQICDNCHLLHEKQCT